MKYKFDIIKNKDWGFITTIVTIHDEGFYLWNHGTKELIVKDKFSQ